MRNLSVIIPSKNAQNFNVSGTAVLENEPKARIILVDDGVGGSERINARFYHFGSRFYCAEGMKPFIFARNVNLGIIAAGDDDVVILNDDAVLQTPGGLSILQQATEAHPEFGIVASTTNCVGNRNQFPKGIGLRDEPRMVCFVAVLIPRRTIEAVGLLDEEFTGYGYDDDSYCLRVRRAGLKIGIHDGCFVDHSSLPSTYRSQKYPAEIFERNRLIFEAKYGAPNHAL